MSYLDQTQGPSPAGLASSIIVQAAIGAAVIAGLTVSDFVAPEAPKPMEPVEYKLPPPPEPPKPQEAQQPTPSTPVYTPPTPFELPKPSPQIAVTSDLPPPLPPTPQITPRIEIAPPAPVPSFSPVAAKPRNDPGGWVMDRDYRSSWVRREYTGIAGFTLDIAATGKVTGCQITSSTGHAELDQATCKLVQQRAKFQPARGPNGEPVAGKFRSSVRWQLPE